MSLNCDEIHVIFKPEEQEKYKNEYIIFIKENIELGVKNWRRYKIEDLTFNIWINERYLISCESYLMSEPILEFDEYIEDLTFNIWINEKYLILCESYLISEPILEFDEYIADNF
jgi:hypothetical protein